MSKETKVEKSLVERLYIPEKSNRNKWGIISIVAVFLIALIVCISIYNSPTSRLSKRLDLGNRYLEEQNYEQAIVEFDKAIEIDPMSVKAYLGKAEACKGLEDFAMARQTLEQGYELTGDERLLAALQAMDFAGEVEIEINENEEIEESLEDSYYVELNYDLSEISILGYKIGQEKDINIIDTWKSEYSKDFEFSGTASLDDDTEYYHMYDGEEEIDDFLFLKDSWMDTKQWIAWVNGIDIEYEKDDWHNFLTCDYNVYSFLEQFDYPIDNKWITLPFDLHLGDSCDDVLEKLQVDKIKEAMIYDRSDSDEGREEGSSFKCDYYLFNTQYGDFTFDESEFIGDNWFYDYQFGLRGEDIGVYITFGFSENRLKGIRISLDFRK